VRDIDETLEQAAAEVRRSTMSLRPIVLPGQRFAHRGWVVFGIAFAAAVLLFGILPLLGGGEGPDTAGTAGTTTSIATSTSNVAVDPTTTVTGPSPVLECSATGVEAPQPAPGLPAVVEDKANAIIEAATSCQLDELAGLAADQFTTSFGGGGMDLLLEWEDSGEGKLDILVELLGTQWARQDYDEGPSYYYWPAAFARDSWDEITDEEMADLLQIYTQDELDQIATFGSYAGWRVGIDEAGNWRFFVAGD
jgi:hypothetical protein